MDFLSFSSIFRHIHVHHATSCLLRYGPVAPARIIARTAPHIHAFHTWKAVRAVNSAELAMSGDVTLRHQSDERATRVAMIEALGRAEKE